MREIHIQPVLNGYIVGVGCKTVVFNSRTLLLSELARYLEHPTEIEKYYISNGINKQSISDIPQPESCGILAQAPQEVCNVKSEKKL